MKTKSKKKLIRVSENSKNFRLNEQSVDGTKLHQDIKCQFHSIVNFSMALCQMCRQGNSFRYSLSTCSWHDCATHTNTWRHRFSFLHTQSHPQTLTRLTFRIIHASNEAAEQTKKKIVLFFKTTRPKTFQLCSELHRINTVFTGTKTELIN